MTIQVIFNKDLFRGWQADAQAVASGAPSNFPTIAEHNAMVATLASLKDGVTDPIAYAKMTQNPKTVYGKSDPFQRFGNLRGVFEPKVTDSSARKIQIQQRNMGLALDALLYSLKHEKDLRISSNNPTVATTNDLLLLVTNEYDSALVSNVSGFVGLDPSLYQDIVTISNAAVALQTRLNPIALGQSIPDTMSDVEVAANAAVVSLAKQFEMLKIRDRNLFLGISIAGGVGLVYLGARALQRRSH